MFVTIFFMDDKSDEELVAAYVAGNEEAFAELVGRHLKTVYTFVLRLVGDEHSAEDIAQETFLKAWRNMKRYRAEASKFKTWILRIARNSAIDYLRKKKHVPMSYFENESGQNVLAETVPDTEVLPDELLARAQDAEALSTALEQLSPRAREVLLLHYANGLTFLEIGDMLNEPQNTVKSRHHRALQALREVLEAQSTKA